MKRSKFNSNNRNPSIDKPSSNFLIKKRLQKFHYIKRIKVKKSQKQMHIFLKN